MCSGTYNFIQNFWKSRRRKLHYFKMKSYATFQRKQKRISVNRSACLSNKSQARQLKKKYANYLTTTESRISSFLIYQRLVHRKSLNWLKIMKPERSRDSTYSCHIERK